MKNMRTHERPAMIICNKCGIAKDESQYYVTCKTVCKDCKKAYQKVQGRVYYTRNKEKVLSRNRAYQASNRDYYRLKSKEWAVKNPDRSKQIARKHYEQNRDSVLARTREYYESRKDLYLEYRRKWREENPGRQAMTRKAWQDANIEAVRIKWAASSSRRRASLIQAVPVWADLEKVQAFYMEAQRLTAKTGQLYHVDHIIPLKGKNVCGLHWEGNLRVIPGRENCIKNNRIIEEIV